MKRTFAAALLLTLGVVATVSAHERPVKMRFSGTFAATTINVQPDSITDEEDFAGSGTFGPFTFRNLRTDLVTPEPSSTCTPGPYIRIAAGGGVFRFQDGSLLLVKVTEGSLCIDLTVAQGHFTANYQITGGTGRFKNASGTLTSTYTAVPAVFDASNSPVFFAASGELTGTVSGVFRGEDSRDDRD